MSVEKIWLITPPFTQINTPYPATSYLKGFLNTIGVKSFQSDLSLEVFLRLFSQEGLEKIFDEVAQNDPELSENAFRIWSLHEHYLSAIDPVIEFLQMQNSTLAHLINRRGFLPQASRFDLTIDLEFFFGKLGLVDLAKYRATLFLEDLFDFINEVIDPHFGFSRYAEKIATSLSNFNLIAPQFEYSSFNTMYFLEEIIHEKIGEINPDLVAITIPFPGNLFAALKTAQIIKSINPEIKIVAGGGYCNTELRSLFDPKVFDYFDFIILDDGERPIQCLIEYLDGKRLRNQLKRTFLCNQNTVEYINGDSGKDIPQRETGVPDYTDLFLGKYLSILEILNPMHRLWSDGRWNKLTMAHGCYWGKCTFCDVSLDYIARYEPLTAALLCDRIEQIIELTGDRGFHFVDEAAPPALMRDLAIEIIRRGIKISWWTNIRFEKSFTLDLCQLLAASGCIAVSGGLEVASDRLLKLIKKGVTVEQVTRVAHAFTQAGIQVHAYLMYGFPTQTAQETVDSLEIVRQLFKNQVIQSAYWHLFTMTAHSPIGLNPGLFDVQREGPFFEGFAENDLFHSDPKGAKHEKFSEGLRISLFNFMNGIGLEYDLSSWFNFRTPLPNISPNFINNVLKNEEETKISDYAKVIWIGGEPTSENRSNKKVSLQLTSLTGNSIVYLTPSQADWFLDIFPRLVLIEDLMTYSEFVLSYKKCGQTDDLLHSKIFTMLRNEGLLIV